MKKMFRINAKGEILCAAISLLPLVVSLYSVSCRCDDYYWFIHSNIHVPFSFVFHMQRALGDPCYIRRGLMIRKLYYSFIHVWCVLLTFGISKSILHGILAIPMNVLCIVDIWNSELFVETMEPTFTFSICLLYCMSSLMFFGRLLDFYITFTLSMLSSVFFTQFDICGHASMYICFSLIQYVVA